MLTESTPVKLRSPILFFSGLLAFGACVMVAMVGGIWVGASQAERSSLPLPQLHASTAAASSVMAVATGQISENAEGIFFLDFLTGDLQCLVYYPRIGAYGARFVTNVQQQLPGGGRNAQYLMVTGTAVATGSTGAARPGNTLVYVTDVTTGTFASYAVPWDRTAESGGRLQSGPLVYVGGGPIRNFVLRDPATIQPAAVEANRN
jgi:hypothetical protein